MAVSSPLIQTEFKKSSTLRWEYINIIEKVILNQYSNFKFWKLISYLECANSVKHAIFMKIKNACTVWWEREKERAFFLFSLSIVPPPPPHALTSLSAGGASTDRRGNKKTLIILKSWHYYQTSIPDLLFHYETLTHHNGSVEIWWPLQPIPGQTPRQSPGRNKAKAPF